ncbi:hypothetical protein MMC30_003415 [Trapelia coarctata]|nr:hypothetical protein [Trapelia coarctata]
MSHFLKFTSWKYPLLTRASLSIILFFAYLLARNYFQNGLNRYPGPLLAKSTKLWHRIDVKSNRHQHHLIALHRKYGDVVRIGPNTLSISRPDYVPRIYGVTAGFLKTSLSVREPKEHAAMTKPVVSAYALSVLTEYELLVDETIRKFMDRVEQEGGGEGGNWVDVALWMRLYALDVIMHLTFSNTLGFLDAGGDVEDFTASLSKNSARSALLAIMPWTAYLVKFNPVIGYFVKENSMFPLWCLKQIQKRLSSRETPKQDDLPSPATQQKDFMDHFLDAAKTDQPPGYNIPQAINWLLVNTLAGADTTAFVLTAILYYLLKSPSKKVKLLQEIQSANLSYPVSWSQSQHLPYLSACIKEGLRLHPPIGMGLERVVPAAGLPISDGYVLPPGTNVSMNPWVINRQPLFGDRVDDFIPERWLQGSQEGDAEYKKRMGQMKRGDLVFGGGTRACTGKYVSFLEMYKVLPTLLRRFEVGLVEEGEEWETVNRWVVKQEGLRCWVRRRRVG